MKKYLRYSLFLTLLLLMSFGTRPSNNSAAASVQRVIDPACVSTCTALMQECILSGKKSCLGVYRHCIAQCGK
jgi:hypothetical protein